jgi:virulence-associated protein VapD
MPESALRAVDPAPFSVPDYPGRMYAIAFDMDTDTMKKTYGKPSWNNGYAEVREALRGWGFDHQQGSVYFGTADVTAVSCVLAVQDLASTLPWFSASVRDIRMLRIEENNDLSEAIEKVLPLPSTPQLFDAAVLIETEDVLIEAEKEN